VPYRLSKKKETVKNQKSGPEVCPPPTAKKYKGGNARLGKQKGETGKRAIGSRLKVPKAGPAGLNTPGMVGIRANDKKKGARGGGGKQNISEDPNSSPDNTNQPNKAGFQNRQGKWTRKTSALTPKREKGEKIDNGAGSVGGGSGRACPPK